MPLEKSISLEFLYDPCARFILAYGTWLIRPPGNQFQLVFAVLQLSLYDIPSPLDTSKRGAWLALLSYPFLLSQACWEMQCLYYRYHIQITGSWLETHMEFPVGQQKFCTASPDSVFVESFSTTSKVSSIQPVYLPYLQ